MEKNITARLVREHILNNPLLTNYLERSIINISSLARELLPIIEKENPKATVESISVALQRLPLQNKKHLTKELKNIINNIQITMRTDISLFCLKKGGGADIRSFTPDDVFYVNHDANGVTVIIDKKNKHLVKGTPVLEKHNLALISLKDTQIKEKVNYRITPGFVHMFLSNISREGINIEDIISTHSQVTFVIDEKDLNKVFNICKQVKDLRLI